MTAAQALSMEEGEYACGEWKRTDIRNGDISSAGLVFRTGGPRAHQADALLI